MQLTPSFCKRKRHHQPLVRYDGGRGVIFAKLKLYYETLRNSRILCALKPKLQLHNKLANSTYFRNDMALTSISILHFEERGSDDVSHRGTFTLKSKLELLGYEVKKVSFMPLKEQTSAISEIESCLKHFHFLIVLIDNLSMANTLEEYVGKIFDVNSLQWKQLKHPTIKITPPVLYFQRLFIVDNADMSETYHNILERYLLYFIKPKPLCKVLKVKNSTSLTCLESLYCDKVKMEISDSCIKLTSFNLEDVLKAESNVKRVLKDGLAASCTHFNYDPELLLNFDKFQDSFEVYFYLYLYSKQNNLNQLVLQIIEGCFQTYQPENVCLCFNGGKDCTVLLHLTLMVLHKRFKNHKEPLLCLYIENHDPFPEIDVFIKNIVSYYDLNILTMKSSIKESLEVLSKNKPHIKACLMGTRRTDPYSQNLNTFQVYINKICKLIPIKKLVFLDD